MPKYKIILTIVFSVEFLIFSFLLSFACGMLFRHTEETTSEYKATVSYVQVTGSGDNQSIRIFTREYSSALTILLKTTEGRFNTVAVRSLQNGDTIQFRVSSFMESWLNTGGFTEIVSLETDEKVIFSLDEYNAYRLEDVRPDVISTIIATGTMLLLALGFGLSLMKDRRKIKQQKKGSTAE